MSDGAPGSSAATRSRPLYRGLGMLGSFVVAIAGARLWQLCNLPLPWLVGSLYAVAFARAAGLPLIAPPGVRQAGQWVIGTSMGLYFSAAVVAQLVSHTGLIVGMALASLLMGVLGAVVLHRRGLADLPTAFFSSIPGGASEMAHLSELWGAAVDRVAAAHALRVMLVVLIVPLALAISGSHGSDPGSVPSRVVAWPHVPAMAAAGLAGVFAFHLLRLPNAWLLGTLAGVATLCVAGLPVSGLPGWVSAAGQLLIGVALGNRFGPGFLHKAPMFLAGIAVISLLYLAGTGILAFGLAQATGLALPTLVLSFAPGGITEMSITASQLNLGVPLVVAAHVVRVVVLMLLAPGAFRLLKHRCPPPGNDPT